VLLRRKKGKIGRWLVIMTNGKNGGITMHSHNSFFVLIKFVKKFSYMQV